MIILAIETSCDDTGIAILSAPEKKGGDFSVLSNIISSQIEVHKKYGGVYPMLAKREHQKNLSAVLVKALKKAGILKSQTHSVIRPGAPSDDGANPKLQKIKKILDREDVLYKKIIPFLKKYQKPDIDLIAVTNGPGLEPCLWVGVNFAKALSYFWDIPIVAVNHIESHILVNYLENPSAGSGQVKLPAIALVVSGGHTQIILMGGIGKYKILGETRDDAAGECFDKAAKILGLGYPGGPIISQLASCAVIPSLTGNPESIVQTLDSRFRENDKFLPRPMIGTKNYDFSFSGLKTAILYHHRKQSSKTQKSKIYIAEMCAEIQQAVIDVLIKKTIKSAKDYNVKTIILGGGVSANSELRLQFQFAVNRHCEQQRSNLNLIFPATDLSTDNALMTAITGYFHQKETKDWREIQANANLRI